MISGTNQRFLLNALSNANNIYGSELFDLSAWCADGRISEKKSCHELFFRSLCDTMLGTRKFAKGECLHLGHNIKYPKLELQHLLKSSALRQVQSWQNLEADYGMLFLSLVDTCPADSASTQHYTSYSQLELHPWLDTYSWQHSQRKVRVEETSSLCSHSKINAV